jgi:hypothetical protein
MSLANLMLHRVGRLHEGLDFVAEHQDYNDPHGFSSWWCRIGILSYGQETGDILAIRFRMLGTGRHWAFAQWISHSNRGELVYYPEIRLLPTLQNRLTLARRRQADPLLAEFKFCPFFPLGEKFVS